MGGRGSRSGLSRREAWIRYSLNKVVDTNSKMNIEEDSKENIEEDGKENIREESKSILDGVITIDGLKIDSGVHSIDRLIQRNVSAYDIKEALENPLKITDVKYNERGRPSKDYIGEKATASVNPETGHLNTVHPTHTKLAKKLKAKRGDK